LKTVSSDPEKTAAKRTKKVSLTKRRLRRRKRKAPKHGKVLLPRKKKRVGRVKGSKLLKRRLKLKRKLKKKGRKKLRRRRLRRPVIVPAAQAPAEQEIPVLHPGINLIGYIRTEIGLGEACRLMAKAFETAQLPFGIINFADPGTTLARNEDLTWIHKERNDAPYKVNFFHMNAPNLRYAHDYPYHPLGKEIFHHRFNIGYWAWELEEFPDAWCNSFELVQEVWAPSTFIRDAVAKKSPVPVIRMPHAVEVRTTDQINRTAFGLPSNQFLFLSMYDTHSLKERKNPQAAIEAFKRAFPPGMNSVGLVVKVNNAHSNPGDLEALQQQMKGYSNIYLIRDTLSRSMVDTLINSTDCFISLHRSEGFGLVLAEAMYLGKPVIGTHWSGNTDFMDVTNSCPVNYELVRIGRDIGPYQAHQIWAEPDIENAAHFMRKIVSEQAWRSALAWHGQQTIKTHFSPEVVGQMTRNRLLELGLL
jgi:glycosyltransferase involved in cell wall biosynthesis